MVNEVVYTRLSGTAQVSNFVRRSIVFFARVGTQALTYAACEGFFPRGFIPDDITNSTPDPSRWPAPKAFFAATTCPTDQFFKDHVFVINTTLCGDLGNATYGSAGCPGTCAQQVANPANFNGIL